MSTGKMYTVYSRIFKDGGPETGEAVVEVRRTGGKTAQEDAKLLGDIAHRPTWVVEESEKE